jgi:cyclophilin family peptidyl-prolyl cis-trans isomerase
MARTQTPDSASAQFFINTVDNAKLDYHSSTPEGFGYCVFGRVVEGMEAVLKIEKVITVTRRGMTNVPEYAVRIKSAEVLPAN